VVLETDNTFFVIEKREGGALLKQKGRGKPRCNDARNDGESKMEDQRGN